MENNKKNYWREPLISFARISGWIVAPIVIALFLGKYLDGKFSTTPWIFLGLTGLSFVISMYGILKELKLYIKSTDQNKKEDEKM